MKYVGTFIQGISGTELCEVMGSLFGERFAMDQEAKEPSLGGGASLVKLQMLRCFYVWEDEGEVEACLDQAPFLVDVLIEAIPYIMQVFGSEVECMLDALSDAKEPDGGILFAGIHIGDAQGMECKLKEFLELFQDKMGKTQAKLCLDIVAEEVVSPGVSMGRVLRVVPGTWLQN